jgi:hypothetical protein
MILVISGLPGSGKSLRLARIILSVLKRNKKWNQSKHNKTGQLRKIYTNLRLADWVYDMYPQQIESWSDTSELVLLRDADVFWDEFATALDSTQWQNMSLQLKRWLQQHRKYGIEIYGTAQDFAQCDKSFRRLTSHLLHLRKLCGSRDKSATLPPVRYIWGLVWVNHLDPQQYDEGKSKFEGQGIDWPMIISREDINVYDTTAEVPLGKYPPLRHIERSCEDIACGHIKTLHV